MADTDEPQIDLREKLAHIDLMLAQHDKLQQEMQYEPARIDMILTQHDRLRQEMRLAPWALVISSMTAGAALFAAAFAFAKLYH